MATLIVVRHGEAEGNHDHRFIGQSQVPLTSLGHRQAAAIAHRFREEPVTRVVASDLIRAVDTVAPLAESFGLPVVRDPRLREIENGDWTGLLPVEIAERWPELWNDYVTGVDVARPLGERWRDVADRVLEAAEELMEEDGTVVVGTHGGPALILAQWATGTIADSNIFRGRLGAVHNGSVTVLDAGPRLVAFNDVGHLAAIPDRRTPFTP